jgi:hypothetical protein
VARSSRKGGGGQLHSFKAGSGDDVDLVADLELEKGGGLLQHLIWANISRGEGGLGFILVDKNHPGMKKGRRECRSGGGGRG